MRRQIARDMTRKAKLEITPYANDQSNNRNLRNLPGGNPGACLGDQQWPLVSG
jgi:hypothetical protein